MKTPRSTGSATLEYILPAAIIILGCGLFVSLSDDRWRVPLFNYFIKASGYNTSTKPQGDPNNGCSTLDGTTYVDNISPVSYSAGTSSNGSDSTGGTTVGSADCVNKDGTAAFDCVQ